MQCNKKIRFDGDFFYCELTKGHDGKHRESGIIGKVETIQHKEVVESLHTNLKRYEIFWDWAYNT